MALSLEEMFAKRSVDRALVEAHKHEMLAETRAYRLRELREAEGRTMADVLRPSRYDYLR